MSDLVFVLMISAFLLQASAFATFIVGDSVKSRRLSRLTDELVMLRVAVRASVCGASPSDGEADSK